MSATAPRYMIVGVVGPEFTGVSNQWAAAEYWVEFTRREDDTFGLATTRTPKIGMVVARMRPGVTLDQVRAFADVSLTIDRPSSWCVPTRRRAGLAVRT